MHGGKSKLDPATSMIPRLITVVELIKREYASMISRVPQPSIVAEESGDEDMADTEPGVSKFETQSLPLLHQYNQIGYLEEADPIDGPNTESSLEHPLQGKNL